ncbi:MAG: hypothetical protein AAGM67_15695, partial [Bacteroidota bacterium]
EGNYPTSSQNFMDTLKSKEITLRNRIGDSVERGDEALGEVTKSIEAAWNEIREGMQRARTILNTN